MRSRARRIMTLASLALLACGPSSAPLPLSTADRASHTALVRTATCDGDATGSGFFVAPDRVVTNHHVIESQTHVTVDVGGESVDVARVYTTPDADLAVLQLARPVGQPVQFAADAAPGDSAWVVGYPRGGSATVTTGRVVDLTTEKSDRVGQTVIRTRAAADLGNSGGPLEDTRGRVVGVVFAIDLEDGWTLAIPASRATAALGDLQETPSAHC